MEFTHERISKLISEITSSEQGLLDLVKQGLESLMLILIRDSFTAHFNFTQKENHLQKVSGLSTVTSEGLEPSAH